MERKKKEKKTFLILFSHKLGSMRPDNSADGVLHGAYIRHCSSIGMADQWYVSIYICTIHHGISIYVTVYSVYCINMLYIWRTTRGRQNK